MAIISGAIVVRRPVEVVFDYVADQRNEPTYNPRMSRSEKLTAGPVGLGTRFRATVTSAGRSADMLIEVTRFERPTRFGVRTTMAAADIEGELTFEQTGSSTRMRWQWHIAPKGLARLGTPLVGWLGRRQEQRIWTALKRYLESGQAGRHDGGQGAAG